MQLLCSASLIDVAWLLAARVSAPVFCYHVSGGTKKQPGQPGGWVADVQRSVKCEVRKGQTGRLMQER
ncbi:unnamed protein product [Tetraodon nigroviridis]|uniref:(spotted green pufferfish) hypothetical protein n=1 Tax=Tetraodon nigroviridis TaxID=99883 RepID=Q4SIL1_TETNG|nr:unnamed protein product [Tetraodon nigroviridis]